MEIVRRYTNYPVLTVLLSNLVSIGIYGTGFYILYQWGGFFAFIYLGYILFFEYRLMRHHCTSCYYWGRRCAFGRGAISACFFAKGNASRFSMKKMTWKDMVPDMMIPLIPLGGGIILLVLSFYPNVLSAVLVLVLLTTAGNGHIRTHLACMNCKQKDLGCPADKWFNQEDVP